MTTHDLDLWSPDTLIGVTPHIYIKVSKCANAADLGVSGVKRRPIRPIEPLQARAEAGPE